MAVQPDNQIYLPAFFPIQVRPPRLPKQSCMLLWRKPCPRWTGGGRPMKRFPPGNRLRCGNGWAGIRGSGKRTGKCSRTAPGALAVFLKMDAAAVMEAQSSEVQQVVEENSEGRSQLWWSHFCSLPEYDPKSSQIAELAWLRDFSAASPEERELSSYRPAGLPEAYTELELAKKLKEIDPGVIRAVEEHVFSPGAWWHQYFRQPEVSDNGLESQEKIMNWLLWYTGLSKEDQERADQRTHLFFAAWE